jgi:filamentous hemagglutinin family protein
LALLSIPVQAGGLPSQGHFVSGRGSIAKADQSLTVKQSSTTGLVNWYSFSVGKQQGVTFDNGSGATLNRVTGDNLSTIAGSLHATGSLYLISNAGVIVSGTGRVVTGGNFIASSGSVSNTAFADGDSHFKPGRGEIINRGAIVAGGTAALSGGAVMDSGMTRASRVGLSARDKLYVSGSIHAEKSDGDGGVVIVMGRHIAIGDAAYINASGRKGGTVLIGGDIHGGAVKADNFVKQAVRTAQTTSVAGSARIAANGTGTSGGDIVIWSDGHTSFSGQLSAVGQTRGGFAEVSAHDLLGFTGHVDLRSSAGNTGTLLLDPENVEIEDGTTTGGTLSGGTFTPNAKNSILSVSDLEAALANADVDVTTGSKGSQGGYITVLDPVTWLSDHTLTLDSKKHMNIHAALTGANLTLEAHTQVNGNITIYKPISMTGTVDLATSAVVLERGQGAIDANLLEGSTGNNLELNGDNLINNLGTFTANIGLIEITDHETLNITGTIEGPYVSQIRIKTVGTGHNIAISGKIESTEQISGAPNLLLTSAGQILEGGTGSIDVNTLTASSVGGMMLDGPNEIVQMQGLNNKGGGGFSLTDVETLKVFQEIDAGSGDLIITVKGRHHDLIDRAALVSSGTVTLVSGDRILQPKLNPGSIDASALTGIARRGVSLTGANSIATLEAFSAGGNFAFADGVALTVDGAVTATGVNDLVLETTGAGSDIAIDAAIATAKVKLVSAGAINEGSEGSVAADKLSGSSVGASTLTNSGNAIQALDGFNSGEAFALTDATFLDVSGALSAPGTAIDLTTTGADNEIEVTAHIDADTVDLVAGGFIEEGAGGRIDATALMGSADGAVSLTNANQITDLGDFTVSDDSSFALTDAHHLIVDGVVDAGNAFVDLTTTGSGHDLAIDGTVSGSEINLIAGGEATESGSGAITASNILNVTADTGIVLTSPNNNIANVGTDQTNSGPNRITQ